MNAAGRLGLYAAGVAVAFAGAYGIAGAVVPESWVTDWKDGGTMQDHSGMDMSGNAGSTTDTALPGLSISADGYLLSPVTAPTGVGEAGELSFRILDAAGEPLTAFETAHEKDLHLIVVRSDGSQFRHDHPTLDATTGTWSIPWTWDEAGSYRVYTDFVPDVTDGPDKVVLSRSVEVAGDVTPTPATEQRTSDTVDGFEVTLDGQLVAGASSELAISVSRDGVPVTTLEPYLGAFGHLVALREGDLAYLHVHAEGDEPKAGETAGPEVRFAATAPTAGRYLLYLDFQVDGQVRTATFVVDAAQGAADGTNTSAAH
ncbi:MAG: heavy metal-binding domain-containing protein [Leifsonia xyli]|nr:MAG: heavy metal-binding domain-containing protein [Leifsonia xyli]